MKLFPCQRSKDKKCRSSTVGYEPKKSSADYGHREIFEVPATCIWRENEAGELDICSLHPEESPMLILRRWLEKQRFIPKDLSSDFLEIFLWASDWNADRAADLLLKYFYFRQEPLPLFKDRDPLSPENVKILDKIYVLPLKKLTKSGVKVIFTGLLKPVVKYDQMEHIKVLIMTIDLLIWENRFGYGEFAIVFDARRFQGLQLIQKKVENQRLIVSKFTESIPGKLSAFYFLCPPPCVAKTAASRNGIWITVVNTEEELAEFIPPKDLPVEYGGTLGTLEELLEKWREHLNKNREFFISFEKKMAHDYRRRICHEKEVAGRTKNWVQELKLEEDEWEYKIQYYKRMKNMPPLKLDFKKEPLQCKGRTRVRLLKDPLLRLSRTQTDTCFWDNISNQQTVQPTWRGLHVPFVLEFVCSF